MTKILIAHISNTLNYGSAMMAINLITGLRKRLGEQVEIHCDCDDNHLQRLKVATGEQNLKSFKPPIYDSNQFRKVVKLALGRVPFVCEVATHFDVMIVLGGDDLSETYMRAAISRGLQYRQINSSCRVILAGQSIGPFNGVYSLLARWVFKDICVITRDDNSYEFCKKILKLQYVQQSRDLAIHCLPFQDDWNKIAHELCLDEDSYVVAVPSGLGFEYTTDLNGYLKTWVELISELLIRDVNRKVVLLAHVLSPEIASDATLIEDIVANLTGEQNRRIVVCKEAMQPAEARAILGGAHFVVTGRMHAAVSTFFQGKPALSLAYSEKYKGVIGRGLGLPEMIIDCRNRQWGSKSEIIRDVLDSLDNLEKGYDDQCRKIRAAIVDCEIMTAKQLDYIAELVEETMSTTAAAN